MKKTIAIVAAGSALSLSPAVFATNGDQMLGVTATQWGRAGAVIAQPEDAGTVLTNPAALANLDIEEVRVDMGFGILNPPRKANGVDSDSDAYLIPSGALALRVNPRLVFGMGMAGLSGMGVDFDDIRPTMAGNQTVVTTKQFYKIAPGFGFKVNDKLSLGAAFNLDYQSLAIHNNMFTLPQTQVYGWGGTFGLTYDINDKVRLGAAYATKQWMSEFEWNSTAGRYSMDMDAPPTLTLGVAVKPMPGLVIEADVKQIWFSDVLDRVSFNTPGGASSMNFGWDDQTVFALGVTKQINKKMLVRAGYNYGESPIGPEDVDNNIGSLAITEHHLSLGLTRYFSDKVAGSLSYVHAFQNDITSSTPSGNKIELEQNIVNLQITYQF
ncbi:MAG: outer membrane protein transport protein [Gammaproteobacteria bacterium]|nr:outer membrane protein transport protein [Gammaproteobacteria bacterium]